MTLFGDDVENVEPAGRQAGKTVDAGVVFTALISDVDRQRHAEKLSDLLLRIAEPFPLKAQSGARFLPFFGGSCCHDSVSGGDAQRLSV